MKVSGKAIIKHAKTGKTHEIESDDLHFEAFDTEEKGMGARVHYFATIYHPELGELEWRCWQYPVGVLEDIDFPVEPHKMIECSINIDFSDELYDKLEQTNINSLLEDAKSVDSRGIKWHLDKLIEQNLVEKSNTLDLLRGLISFSLALNDPDDPFKPVFVGADGTRTLVPSDFKKEQIDVITEFARTIDNPGLRARLADICWFIQKDIDMAEIAIDAYCESVEKVRKSEAVFLDGSSFGDSFIDDSSLGISAKDIMTRAAQISHATEWKSEASQRFKLLLKNLLEDAEKKEDGHGFHLMGSISLEYENKIPPIERLAEIAERLAKKPDIHPDLQDDLFHLVDDARRKIKDITKEEHRDKDKSTHKSNSQSTHKLIRARLRAVQKATPLAESIEWNSRNQKIHITPVPANNIVLWEGDLERLHDEISDIKNNDRLSNTHAALISEIDRLESRLEKYKNSPQQIHDEMEVTLRSVQRLENEEEITSDIHTQRFKEILNVCILDIEGDVPEIQEVVEKRKRLRLAQLSEDEQKSISSITEDVIPYIEEERIKQDMQEDIEALKENQDAAASQEKTSKIYRLISRLSRMFILLLKNDPDIWRTIKLYLINKFIEIIFNMTSFF